MRRLDYIHEGMILIMGFGDSRRYYEIEEGGEG